MHPMRAWQCAALCGTLLLALAQAATAADALPATINAAHARRLLQRVVAPKPSE